MYKPICRDELSTLFRKPFPAVSECVLLIAGLGYIRICTSAALSISSTL